MGALTLRRLAKASILAEFRGARPQLLALILKNTKRDDPTADRVFATILQVEAAYAFLLRPC